MPEPTLVSGELRTKTLDENKDRDTCIFAEITSADGHTLLAYVTQGDCDPSGFMLEFEYEDGSRHAIPMRIENTLVTYSLCKGFHVKMWQVTHGGKGHDTWKFDVNVILRFSDGSELNAYRGGQVLVSKSTDDRPTIEYNQA